MSNHDLIYCSFVLIDSNSISLDELPIYIDSMNATINNTFETTTSKSIPIKFKKYFSGDRPSNGRTDSRLEPHHGVPDGIADQLPGPRGRLLFKVTSCKLQLIIIRILY